jgi:biotin carboxyl carrier protein
MASGTQGATSTYTGGKGISFAKDIASRVVDAATEAKEEKKLQQKIIADGGTVPEKDQKGLFVKALKKEFISNPINDIKKSLNKKAAGVGKVAGLFGGKGEKLQSKLTGGGSGLFKIKQGFDRSGYKKAKKQNNSGDGGGGGGGASPIISGLGELVLDIQQIATSISSMQGLISTQMNLSLKMSDSIAEIRSVLADQLDIQQEQAENEQMAQREASLEASKSSSGTAESTSTYVDSPLTGFFGSIMDMVGKIQNIMGILEELPIIGEMLGGAGGLASAVAEFALPVAAVAGVGTAASYGGQAIKGLGDSWRELDNKQKKGVLQNPLVSGVLMMPPFTPIGLAAATGMIPDQLLDATEDPIARYLDYASAAAQTIGAPFRALIELALAGGDIEKSNKAMAGVDADIRESWRKVFQGSGGTKGSWGNLYEKKAAGGVMIGEAGPEAVMNLHGAAGKKMLSGRMGSDSMNDVQDTYYAALAGSTLAITKDFIEGLGPVGSSIAPIIQDDVSKLGRQFDIPPTATKVSVGGLGLREDPQASKKGQDYLKELVKGTLEKLAGKKNDKKKNESSSGGTIGGSPTPNAAAPSAAGKNDFTFGDSIASGLSGRQGANQQTVVDDKGTSKVGASPADVFGQLQSFDKTKLKGKVVRLSSGITNNPSDLKTVEEQIKYLVSVGAQVQLVGVTNAPPKDKPNLKGLNDSLSALASKYSDKGVSFLGGFTPGSDGIHPANASKLNSSYNVDVQPGGKIGAASGAKLTLQNSSGSSVTSWKSLEVHHPSEGPAEKYRPSPNAGKKNLAKDIVLLKDGNTNVGVPSPIDGTIGPASFSPGMIDYGPHFVEVVSGDQKVWIGHMKSANVKVGDKVKAGQVLGVQGSMGQSTGPHVHIQGNEDIIKNWVSGMLGGNYTSGVATTTGNEDGNTEDVEEQDVNPFEAMQKAFSSMIVGAALSQGDYKNNEEFDAAKTKFENAFKAPSATPSTNQVSTSGDGASATPNRPSTTPTAAKPPSGIPPSSPAPASPRAATAPSIPTIIPSASPTMGTESLYRPPIASYASGGMYRPLSYS